ncbi:IS30 family transposase [Antrihabitans cavernicola]|uniref:IS30 family transposase n=1 Tax=Antrihabitans cavernicola TaxID=2495913 RepID=UPI001F3815CD|nr:IS30 family transposase [Spelaeibacter cavernicola]
MVHRRWQRALPRFTDQSPLSDTERPTHRDHRRPRPWRRVKDIAERIGKSYQSVYREIARNWKPDGTYQPWYAHGQAYQRRRRPKQPRLAADADLRKIVATKLTEKWSPAQISRWLRRRYRRRSWHLCTETIYESVYQGVVIDFDQGARSSGKSRNVLRSGRIYRHRRGRGRSRDGALKQRTNMRSIHDRPASVDTRRQAGHWESQCCCQAASGVFARAGSW